MSEPEIQSTSQMQVMKPYLIAAGVLFLLLVVVYFWPADSTEPEPTVAAPVPAALEVTQVQQEKEPAIQSDTVPTEVFQPKPIPKSLVVEANDEPESINVIEEELPQPIIDESDGAVKKALISLATSPQFASLLVDESLLQRFVINVNSIANKESAPKHSMLKGPEKPFKIYQQAQREWIDPASFKRYNVYVDVLEAFEPDELVNLLDTYQAILEEKFAEISPPDANFNNALIYAIDELLDTPKVPVPIEVYSDSVMYKFKDTRLESLSMPQKQLLRTGPENMRRIKQVLRDLKSELEERE